MSRADLTCNESMPTSDEKLDARNQGYRPGSAGLYGGPSTSAGPPRYPALQKPASARALYPGSLIPSISGLPQGLTMPGVSAAPKIQSPNPLLAANAALVAEREAALRKEQQKKKEEEELLKKNFEAAFRATSAAMSSAGPSTSSVLPGIIRPTPTMPYGSPLLHHPQPIHPLAGPAAQRAHAGLLAAHDYLGSTPVMRQRGFSPSEPQVKQIPKGGGLVHAPYNPAMKNRLQEQREPAHAIARPIPRHVGDQQPSAAAQYALKEAEKAEQLAQQHRSKVLQEKRDAESRERQLLLDRQRQEEDRQMRADMSGIAPIVRTVQRGAPAQPILDPSRLNRGLPAPAPVPQRGFQNFSMATVMANLAQEEREKNEMFERERDRLERVAAQPMTIPPPAQHASPLHIPSILQGRNNWSKVGQQSSPLRPGFSPGLGASGLSAATVMPSFDNLLGLNNANSAIARLHQNLLLSGASAAYSPLGQHVSPSPSTPVIHATPSPRPSILRRKGNDASAAKRRLGFDESNPQTVGELATAQLASGVIGLSDAKKIKLEVEIKKELMDVPSTSATYFGSGVSLSTLPCTSAPSTSAEPTPQKKRQRKQQFDANQAPEQIRMQISEPPFMPVMGMHSNEYPGEVTYYQLPPEAPKKKRGRPSSLAKEQALIEAQSTTRSVIVDVDEPKIVMEKKKGGRKKMHLNPGHNPVPPPSAVKDEPLDTPSSPPRPSSSARPKSAILQQHHAAFQLQLQQHMLQQQQRQTPLQSPQEDAPSPFTPEGVNDFPLEFDSDEDLVSSAAIAAARECAEQLGLVGPDGEPRETTPVRLAREQEEAEEEEEKHRERIRINSAGLEQLQAAIRKKAEMDRLAQEEEEREMRNNLQKERSALRLIDRNLRFLSHDKSIIRKFFRKVKGIERKEGPSEDSDDEERASSSLDVSREEEGSKDSEEAVLTLTKAQFTRLKRRGGKFTLVKEVDRNEETAKAAEAAKAILSDSDDDEEEEELTEEQRQERIRRQVKKVERLNAELILDRLVKKKEKKDEKNESDDELAVAIERLEKRIGEMIEVEISQQKNCKSEGEDGPKETRKELIPLDALGDRENFIRPSRRVGIAPSDSLATPRLRTKKDLIKVGKNMAVKKALGFMQLWKRVHRSSEDKRGIVVDEPVDIEGDLLRARRRDVMIERSFNRMKKDLDRDRLREKMREELIEKRMHDKKQRDWENKDDDDKTVELLTEEMVETIEKDENEDDQGKSGNEEEQSEGPKDESENKEDEMKDEENDQDGKVDEAEMTEGAAEEKNEEEQDEEELLDPIEKARLQKENDALLRRAIEEVDAKISRRAEREGITKSLQSYFAKPGTSHHDADILDTITALRTHHLEEDNAKRELEMLLDGLVSSDEENEVEEREDREIALSSNIVKISATRKTRSTIPFEEWDSLTTSFHRAEVVDLFGVPFTQCEDEKLVPILTLEEREAANKAHLQELSEQTVQKVEKTLRMEQRYQDHDALPRAITRLRRCEAVDNAMLRDEEDVEEIDPEVATMEDQVIGFLTKSIYSTKQEAFLEKQMRDLEKKKDKQARSHSPILFYKRSLNQKSILANYTLDYNARDKWVVDDEEESTLVKYQQDDIVKRRFERLDERRRKKLDNLAESALSQHEERYELPCPAKSRQDAAKEKILEKHSKKTRALMLQAYQQFFDDEGRELNGASSSEGGKKTSPEAWINDQLSAMKARDESVIERNARMVGFVRRHELDVDSIPKRAAAQIDAVNNAWFDRLKSMGFSESEKEDSYDEEDSDEDDGMDVKEEVEEEDRDGQAIESGDLFDEDGETRIHKRERTNAFDLEDIRRIYESEQGETDEEEVEDDLNGDDGEEGEVEDESSDNEDDSGDSEDYVSSSELEDEQDDIPEMVATKKTTASERDSKEERKESEEISEDKETGESEDVQYEDHVVTMTRGGKTTTQVVRRPSNAMAMNVPPPAKFVHLKESPEEERTVFTKINEEGRLVKYIKVKRKVTKKLNEDEQYQEYCETHSTRFVPIPEENNLILDDEKMMRDLKIIKRDNAKYAKIQQRIRNWEVTEEEKAEMVKQIEDELDEEEFGPSTSGRKIRMTEGPVDDPVFVAPDFTGQTPDEPITDEERRRIREGVEDEDSDEDDDVPDFIRLEGNSSSEDETEENEFDPSTLRPFRNIKTVDTTEDAKTFPWLCDVTDYDGIAMSVHEKKLAAMRKTVVDDMDKKRRAIKARVSRFKINRNRKQHYVSPFHSVYQEEIPDELANDLNVLKLIVKTTLNDDTISSSELVMLRKKFDLTRRAFADVIKRKSIDSPKAFKDLVRFAIQRGEKYAQREADMKALKKWQNKVESKKMRRSKRKAILKEVKVTRQKLNTHFGRKFRRADWSLKNELGERWRRSKLIPRCVTPTRMGNKQLMEEMRRVREELEEEENVCGSMLLKEREELKSKDEAKLKAKEAKRAEYGKTPTLHRKASGISWLGDEAVDAEVRTKGLLRDNLVMFETMTEEIEYSCSDEEPEDKGSDGSTTEPDSEEDRARRERSWTFETVKNSSDDESFVDYGHVHYIGAQVFPDATRFSPQSASDSEPAAADKLADKLDDAFPEASTSGLQAAVPEPMTTPPKSDTAPRPFLTLAQRKAYFTEETEEERKQKEEEEARKRAEEERLEREKKEEEERIAEEKRIEDEKRAEIERLERVEREKEDDKFESIMDQIEEDTWEKQLKIIIDRTMTSFRRTEAVEYLLASCDDMDCDEERMISEIEKWEKAAEKKRLAVGSMEYMSLKSLFEAESMAVLRKGVSVQKKKDTLSAFPDAVLVEDLVDSMCTFITSHIDDVTILSELRMNSKTNRTKIRIISPSPERDELLVKKSIAAVGEDESKMVEKTLQDMPYNSISVVGATSTGVILSASREDSRLLDDVNVELRMKDAADADAEVDDAVQAPNYPNLKHTRTSRRNHGADFVCVREDLFSRLDISCKAEIDSLETVLIEDAMARGSTPDIEGVLDYAVEDEPAPISSNMTHPSRNQRGIRAIKTSSGLISKSILREISDRLRSADEMHERQWIDMPEIENKKLQDEFFRKRDIINVVRVEMREKIGEVINGEKLNQYLLEHVWTDEGTSSNVRAMIDDIKKRKERERRGFIDIGDVSARVFDLSAVGQLERWMDDVFYLSPFSEDGKRITSKISRRPGASLHCRLVLKREGDEDEEVKRIHPEILMRWKEDNEGRREVVHKFSSIAAHQWESIQKLIRLAGQQREEAGVVSSDDDEERSVLIPVKSGDSKGVVVVEKEQYAVDQEGIVNNDKFVDLELRHSARLLKHRTVGFGTKKAINLWRHNFDRAVKTGRIMKTVVDETEPERSTTSRNLRDSIRYKSLLNSIKQTKGITKERVEILGDRLCEKGLRKARGVVNKQIMAIRRHHQRKLLAEMRAYNAEMVQVGKLRLERNLMRAEMLKKNDDESMELNKGLPPFDNSLDNTQVKNEVFDVDGTHLSAECVAIKPPLAIKAQLLDHSYHPNNIADVKPNVAHMQDYITASNHTSMKPQLLVDRAIPESNHVSEKKAEDEEDEGESDNNEGGMVGVVVEAPEGEDDDEDDQEEEIREIAHSSRTHPLKKHVKTLDELSRPLTERETNLLHLLKEKRARGESLMSWDDLRKPLKATPIHANPEVQLLDVEGGLKEKKLIESVQLDVDSEDDDDDVDLECVLFHSYPERVRKGIAKAMTRREERIRVAIERYEMYRRREERRKKRENEEGATNSETIVEDDEVEENIGPDMVDTIPRGFCTRWMRKTVNGERMLVRRIAYRRYKQRAHLRHPRVIMGRRSRGRIPFTRLHYVIDGPKSEELIRAEEDAERTKANLDNIAIDVDTSHIPITKEVLSRFVQNQVQSDEAKLEYKSKLIDEHDRANQAKGVRFLDDDDVDVAVEEEAEIEKMIEESVSHDRAIETFKGALESMRSNALEKNVINPMEQLNLELDEAVENERRILHDYLRVIQTMDSKRYQELARLWTYDIESDDDEDILEEKRWARVRQFVLQKPEGALMNWENRNAYVEEWEEKVGIPTKADVNKVMGPAGPDFRGIEKKRRQGYFINEDGFPVKPTKPHHFKPLESDPEYLDNSDIDDMCHPDLNERHEDNLLKRKTIADKCNRDFSIRQEDVRERGVKRRAALMRKHKKTEKNMPELGVGLQRSYEQNSVFDPLPLAESYWSHVRRTEPNMEKLLKRRLENTREMFAAVVQPMYRTILVLRETKDRLAHHLDIKEEDSDEEERRQRFGDSSDSESDSDESESEEDEDDEQPTYVLRKRPRLCNMQEVDEDGDDEEDDSDRPSSRSDSEREESASEAEEDEESEDPDVTVEEQPKQLKKPTLFNREMKREDMGSPDVDVAKVKEEAEQEEVEPSVTDVTPKKRPQARKNRGRPRKSIGSGRSDSESPLYEAPPTSLRRATGKRPLINDRSAVDFYDEDEQIRLAIEESLKDQPSTSSGIF